MKQPLFSPRRSIEKADGGKKPNSHAVIFSVFPPCWRLSPVSIHSFILLLLISSSSLSLTPCCLAVVVLFFYEGDSTARWPGVMFKTSQLPQRAITPCSCCSRTSFSPTKLPGSWPLFVPLIEPVVAAAAWLLWWVA